MNDQKHSHRNVLLSHFHLSGHPQVGITLCCMEKQHSQKALLGIVTLKDFTTRNFTHRLKSKNYIVQRNRHYYGKLLLTIIHLNGCTFRVLSDSNVSLKGHKVDTKQTIFCFFLGTTVQVILTLNPPVHVHLDTTVQAAHPHQPSLSPPKVTSLERLPLHLSSALLEHTRRYIHTDGI